jgi:formate hydrogenlyase subunit 3/multisubunit Na+/H+ antiporter MnhD subunit
MKNRLRLDYNDGSEIWLSDQHTLRILIGILGMLLPLLVCAVLFVDTPWHSPLHSISHYYYTRAAGVFVIVISLLAIFLIIYKGKKPIDFWLSTVAGIFALCVVLFPTNNISAGLPDQVNPYSVTLLKRSPFRETFHYVSAAIFLLSLAAMLAWVFTLSDKEKQQRGKEKRRRNRVYRVCALIMVLAVCVVFFGGALKWIPGDVYESNAITFWMETVAVEFFGFAWMVKGGVILRDKTAPVTQESESSNNTTDETDYLMPG